MSGNGFIVRQSGLRKADMKVSQNAIPSKQHLWTYITMTLPVVEMLKKVGELL